MEMSLPLILFLVFDAFIVLIVVIVVMHKQMSPQHPVVQMFETEAQARGGQVHAGFTPRLEFPLKDLSVSAWIAPGGKNTPPYLVIETSWITEQDIRLRIYRENFITRWVKEVGLQDVPLNNTAFDEVYYVTGNDPQRIQQLLDHEIQDALLSIKEKKPTVEIGKKKFRLVIPGTPNSIVDVQEPLNAAVRIINRLREVMVHA